MSRCRSNRLPVENVVDAATTSAEQRSMDRKSGLAIEGESSIGISHRLIDIHGKNLQSRCRPSGLKFAEPLQLVCTLRFWGPEIQQKSLAAKTGELALLAVRSQGFGKSGAGNGASSQVPTFRGSASDSRTGSLDNLDGRKVSKGFHPRRLGALGHPDSMIDRQIVKFLHQPARPADVRVNHALRFSQAKENVLAVLR